MRRGVRVVVAAGLVVMLLAGHAFAHVQTSLDEDDSPGGLDLVAGRQRDRVYYIAGTHPETTSRRTELVLKLVTYESWEEVGSVGTFVGFEFDLDGDGRFDRCLKVRADGNLKAEMYKDSFGCAIEVEESKIGTRTARRPDQHSIKVIIPKRWLGRGVESYRWRAVTSFEEDGHRECSPPDPLTPERQYGTCVDFTRWAKHTF